MIYNASTLAWNATARACNALPGSIGPRRDYGVVRRYSFGRLSHLPSMTVPRTLAILNAPRTLSKAGNSRIEYRWAEGHLGRLPEMAADVVRRGVSVIFTGGGSEAAHRSKGSDI
jgi:hypothetical protein